MATFNMGLISTSSKYFAMLIKYKIRNCSKSMTNLAEMISKH